MERIERQGPSPRGAANHDGESKGGGDSIRGQQRGISFAAGEAVTTPNESKPRVELGDPKVALVANVVRGKTASLDASLADVAGEDPGLVKTAAGFDLSLVDSNAANAMLRDQVDEIFVRHMGNAPKTEAFKIEHGRRAAAMIVESKAYGGAVAHGTSLRLNGQGAFAVFGMADRDYRQLEGTLRASGHARSSGDEVQVDADALALEAGAFQAAARDTGLAGTNVQDTGHEALGRCLTRVGDAASGMANHAFGIRSRILDARETGEQAALAKVESRMAIANDIDSVIGLATSFQGKAMSYVNAIGSIGGDTASVPNVGSIASAIANLIDGPERERLKGRVVGLQALAKANANVAMDLAFEDELARFEHALEDFQLAFASTIKETAARSDDLHTIGGKLDTDSRTSRKLGAKQERMLPVADRFARLEAARNSHGIGITAAARLAKQTEDLENAVAPHSQHAHDVDLYDLRNALGETNVGTQLRRKITRLGQQMTDRHDIIATSLNEEK